MWLINLLRFLLLHLVELNIRVNVVVVLYDARYIANATVLVYLDDVGLLRQTDSRPWPILYLLSILDLLLYVCCYHRRHKSCFIRWLYPVPPIRLRPLRLLTLAFWLWLGLLLNDILLLSCCNEGILLRINLLGFLLFCTLCIVVNNVKIVMLLLVFTDWYILDIILQLLLCWAIILLCFDINNLLRFSNPIVCFRVWFRNLRCNRRLWRLWNLRLLLYLLFKKFQLISQCINDLLLHDVLFLAIYQIEFITSL